jgi:CheY-like chemotaxis protein
VKIVLAEDNDLNRDMLKRRLERRKFDVIEAIDGEETLELVRLHLPDLVLLDLSMPVIDGWEVADILSSDPETAHIPLVALTGHAIRSVRDRATDAGCCDVLTKPFQFKELLEVIERNTTS